MDANTLFISLRSSFRQVPAAQSSPLRSRACLQSTLASEPVSQAYGAALVARLAVRILNGRATAWAAFMHVDEGLHFFLRTFVAGRRLLEG